MAFDKSDSTSPYYQPDTTDWDNLLAPTNTMEPDLSPSQQAGASDPEIFYPLQHYTEQAISTNTPVSVSHDLADSQTHIAAAAKVNDKFFPGHQSQNNFSSSDYTAFPVQRKKSKFYVKQNHTNSFDHTELADIPVSQSGSGYTASGGTGSFDQILNVYKAESSTVAAQQFKDNMKQQPSSNANADKEQQSIITGFPAAINQALTIYKKRGSDFPISLQTIDDMTDIVIFKFAKNFHNGYIMTNIMKNLPEIKNQVKQQLYPGYDSPEPSLTKTRTITVTDVENSLTSVLQSYIPSAEVYNFSNENIGNYNTKMSKTGADAQNKRQAYLDQKDQDMLYYYLEELFNATSNNYSDNTSYPEISNEDLNIFGNSGMDIINKCTTWKPDKIEANYNKYYHLLESGDFNVNIDAKFIKPHLNKNNASDSTELHNAKLALLYTARDAIKELNYAKELTAYTAGPKEIMKQNSSFINASTPDLKERFPEFFYNGNNKDLSEEEISAAIKLTAKRLQGVYEHNNDLGIAIANRVYSQGEGYNLLDGLAIYALGALSLLSNDCANLQQDIIKASYTANKIKGDQIGEFIKNHIVDIISIATCFIPGAGFTGTVRNVIETVINVSGHAANINIYLDRCDAIMNDPQYKDNPKDQFLALCGATADIISVTGFNETMRFASNAGKTGNYLKDAFTSAGGSFASAVVNNPSTTNQKQATNE